MNQGFPNEIDLFFATFPKKKQQPFACCYGEDQGDDGMSKSTESRSSSIVWRVCACRPQNVIKSFIFACLFSLKHFVERYLREKTDITRPFAAQRNQYQIHDGCMVAFKSQNGIGNWSLLNQEFSVVLIRFFLLFSGTYHYKIKSHTQS
jgi:hypothetical protein